MRLTATEGTQRNSRDLRQLNYFFGCRGCCCCCCGCCGGCGGGGANTRFFHPMYFFASYPSLTSSPSKAPSEKTYHVSKLVVLIFVGGAQMTLSLRLWEPQALALKVSQKHGQLLSSCSASAALVEQLAHLRSSQTIAFCLSNAPLLSLTAYLLSK